MVCSGIAVGLHQGAVVHDAGLVADNHTACGTQEGCHHNMHPAVLQGVLPNLLPRSPDKSGPTLTEKQCLKLHWQN